VNQSRRPMPILAVIAVSALSGALASALVGRTAMAVTLPTVQDPRVTTLIKYVSVDDSGNIALNGSQITITGTTVQIKASGNASLQGSNTSVTGTSTSLTGQGVTSIKGALVTIN
jgi:biopolymer transport protein ExbD